MTEIVFFILGFTLGAGIFYVRAIRVIKGVVPKYIRGAFDAGREFERRQPKEVCGCQYARSNWPTVTVAVPMPKVKRPKRSAKLKGEIY